MMTKEDWITLCMPIIAEEAPVDFAKKTWLHIETALNAEWDAAMKRALWIVEAWYDQILVQKLKRQLKR